MSTTKSCAVKRVALALCAVVPSCATLPSASDTPPMTLAPSAPGDQSKCSIAANQENPLVTEWPASEKANLEARLREGSVLVSYAGCSMKLLGACRARGGYAWRRTTTSTDVVEIRNADELYAKLPLGAVALEGELARSGRLEVQTTISGQLELQGFDPGSVPADGSCLGATHVVAALSVGAFKMHAGGGLKFGGGANVGVLGEVAKGSRDRQESTLRAAGDPDACKQSNDTGAHPECGSPIQVFLRPLPGAIRDRGTAGSVKVNFLSGRGDKTWAVVVGDRELCKTPCNRWVDPAVPYSMKIGGGFFQETHLAEVPDLRPLGSGPLQVRAYPTSIGKLAGGINMVVWGGMATLAGIALTAVGCGGDNGKMCTGGLITLPLGLALAGPGIYLIATSGARAEVGPSTSDAFPTQVAIAGRF